MTERRPSFGFDELEVQYIREVPSADIARFVDDLSDDFMVVRTERRNFAVGAGGVGFQEAAVVLLLGAPLIVAKSFLEQLGKDAYAYIRKSVGRLYQGRLAVKTGHGYYHPLKVLVHLEAVSLDFIFTEGLTEEDFDRALADTARIARAAAQENMPDGVAIQFRYDKDAGEWTEAFRFSG